MPLSSRHLAPLHIHYVFFFLQFATSYWKGKAPSGLIPRFLVVLVTFSAEVSAMNKSFPQIFHLSLLLKSISGDCICFSQE